ncbi:MAG: hypothetical protein ABI599_05885 [Flavobacteriales bacterium]
MAKNKVPTTKQRSLTAAYEQMLFQPGVWITLGAAKQTILNARVKVRNGVASSEARKRRWLAKAGWLLVVEEQWAPTVEPLSLATIKSMSRKEILMHQPKPSRRGSAKPSAPTRRAKNRKKRG